VWLAFGIFVPELLFEDFQEQVIQESEVFFSRQLSFITLYLLFSYLFYSM
jgi:hypothetical protein